MESLKIFATTILALFLWGTGSVCAAPPESEETKTVGSSVGGWLGVSIQTMTPDLARSMNVKTDAGALVADVMEESPAEKAGLQEEDIIIEFGGKTIADADDLRKAVRNTAPGSTVPVTVTRTAEKKTLQVRLGKAPRLPEPPLPELPPLPPRTLLLSTSDVMGLKLRTLTGQLGAYFQAPGNRGVLVEEVQKESEAVKAGFLAGDVITRVAKEEVEEVRDVRRALRNCEEGEKVDVEVIRRGATQKLTLAVEKPERTSIHRFRFHMQPHHWKFKKYESDGLDDLLQELENLSPDLDGLRLELEGINDDVRRARDLRRQQS